MASKEDYALHIPGAVGSYAPYLRPAAQTCDLTGLTVTALPPGRVEVKLRDVPAMLNVTPHAGLRTPDYLYRLEGRDLRQDKANNAWGGYDLLRAGQTHEIRCANPGWELGIVLEEDRLSDLSAEAWNGSMLIERDVIHRRDDAVISLARLAIDHLRSGKPDRLYIQGLAIAMTARALSADSSMPSVPTRGTERRIARAIDYIEAHLGEDLSVAAIASAAAMSPSWLQTAFKANTGQPVFAYVRERRLERARILLADRRLSLSQIAFECGFSSHSHMTRLFTKGYGCSPSQMRG
ncbi:AraC family transcriptional regulator [Cognatiyoonia sp. IB215182]|uniref:AraC family transcriptional regulator n=1 Tax=Cognatiyoonia sp. IB215182 TaxID=3097353 RepID=UPI002A0D3401|nr:AraC family transcriptional regulator [Cognatiyoonia sp. IB215182]MDX8350856.1 AraC family transcriptional regulator [Cognatiyoonia sp. IB215182]